MLDPSVSMSSNAQNTSIIGSESPTANQIKNIDRTPNTSTSDQLPPSSLLCSPSAFFTGCDTYLQALKECFSPETDGERKKFLLYGMEGVGKTQICLKFMEQYGKAWFSDIFWIDASSEQRIDLCLRQISKQKKLGSMPSVESALEWLSGRENWLMVFDNADGGLEKFIPPGFWGSILITSRDRGLERITLGTHSLEVTEMGEEDAIALLLKSAMADDNSVNVAIAQKLVAALGYIPLAIDQAGAYVHSCRCGLTQYLELFIKHHAKLISDKEIHGASLSAYGTWDLSIEEIKHRAKGQNSAQSLAAQSALIFLDCFAFLHQDNISGKIFKNAALNFGSRKGERTNGLPQSISLLDSKTLLLYDDGNWDALQFKAGIEVLLSFSLIRSSGMLYYVHPLIQTWSRDRIPVMTVADCCQKSRALLACSFNFNNQEDGYRFCTLLAPHIKANGEHAAQFISDDQYFDDQNDRFASIFSKVGDWDQAEKLWIETLNTRETRLGINHPDTLGTMGNLALTYHNQRKWKEAESLKVKVMEASKELLRALHPEALSAIGDLATAYSNQGKWKEAEGLEAKVMEARKETLGSSHPGTLTAIGNLAVTYSKQGRWKEAESLQIKLMEARNEILGPLHPETLTTMGNLAATYSNQGKWEEAKSLEVKVMEARKGLLGALHPDTLTAIGNLALTYSNQGNWEEAERLEVEVMEASKEVLGALHPNTLGAMGNLASTYVDQGRWEEAEILQMEVMDTSSQVLGALHPDTLTAMGNLAETYKHQMNWEEAESLQMQVMEARKEILGLHHPDTLVAMGNLALTYSNQGNGEEAESLQVEVMETSKKILGSFHPDTLTAMANLAVTYVDQGKWEEAENLQVKVMDTSKEILGALHPDTLRAMCNIALTYSSQEKWEEAESLEVKVMEARKEIFGALHPETLTAMGNLAATYSNQGKLKEAESLEVKVMAARKEILGPLHLDTLITMSNLAFTYRDQNKTKDAKELLDTSVKGMQQVLGIDHPTTLQYMQELESFQVSDPDTGSSTDNDPSYSGTETAPDASGDIILAKDAAKVKGKGKAKNDSFKKVKAEGSDAADADKSPDVQVDDDAKQKVDGNDTDQPPPKKKVKTSD